MDSDRENSKQIDESSSNKWSSFKKLKLWDFVSNSEKRVVSVGGGYTYNGFLTDEGQVFISGSLEKVQEKKLAILNTKSFVKKMCCAKYAVLLLESDNKISCHGSEPLNFRFWRQK